MKMYVELTGEYCMKVFMELTEEHCMKVYMELTEEHCIKVLYAEQRNTVKNKNKLYFELFEKSTL